MQFPIEPFVVSGEGVLTPPNRDRWVTAEMFEQAGGKPVYTAIEVAHAFFGKSTTWLRKRLAERKGTFETPRTDAGHRRFGLNHIEDFAHVLLEDDAISPLQFAMTIRVIKSVAILNLYEIGDTGFLLDHWNGAIMQRRQVVTALMELLEMIDAGRKVTDEGSDFDSALFITAQAFQTAEHLNGHAR
jgi:hypothetical protein